MIADYWLGLLIDPEDGSNMFRRNFDELPDYSASHHRRQHFQCDRFDNLKSNTE
jgi:hypothetical protein